MTEVLVLGGGGVARDRVDHGVLRGLPMWAGALHGPTRFVGSSQAPLSNLGELGRRRLVARSQDSLAAACDERR
jgi:hypothetical protein